LALCITHLIHNTVPKPDDSLEQSIEAFTLKESDVFILLGGDFNGLDIGEVTERTGLTPLVIEPTRGANTLDMLMTSRPGLYTIRVINSPLNADHKAIVATTEGTFTAHNKTRTQVYFRKRSPDQHASLLRSLKNLDLNEFRNLADPQEAWNLFYTQASSRLEYYYPSRKITITSKDPEYMTPEIKSLLRRKNKLMRKGRIEES